MWAVVADDAVVSVGTTTPYYRSRGGLAIGTGVGRIRSMSGAKWVACRRALSRQYGAANVYFTPGPGRGDSGVKSLSMIEVGYDFGPCVRRHLSARQRAR